VTLVSVLMPFRDASATIEQAAQSILAQQGVELELVAVDDGSRDDGPARLLALARRDARVVVVGSEGAGIASALTRGLAVARGEIIARMDADDVALPTRLAKERAALEGDERLGVVGSRVVLAGEIGEGMRLYVAWQNGVLTPEDHARELFVESPLCHPSTMLRRRALVDAGGWRDVAWAEDYDLWLRLDALGWHLAKVPEVLHVWHRGVASATFRDARYAKARFIEAKARYLAPKLRTAGRPLVVWGAGPTGRRLARALVTEGVRPARFVDIDPAKIGGIARTVPIVAPADIRVGDETLVVAVAARGARGLVRAWLAERGFVEGTDFICAA
jgi:glycosyltransferase involved in cell wall biosynthesis